MKYVEFGFGNPTFISSELEDESRIASRVAGHVVSCYLRFWIGNLVLILDSKEGVKTTRKSAKKCKVLFGLAVHNPTLGRSTSNDSEKLGKG